MARQPIPHIAVFQENGKTAEDFTFHFQSSPPIRFDDYLTLATRAFKFSFSSQNGDIFILHNTSVATKLTRNNKNVPVISTNIENSAIGQTLDDVIRGTKITEDTAWLFGSNNKSLFWNVALDSISKGPSHLFATQNFCTTLHERDEVMLVGASKNLVSLRSFNLKTWSISSPPHPGFSIEKNNLIMSCQVGFEGKPEKNIKYF